MMETIEDKIRIKQTQLSVENDPIRKQALQQQLLKLKLNLEIEKIRKRIQQMG